MTEKTPQELAEENADKVRSSDQLAREAAGVPDPPEGHNVLDHRPLPEVPTTEGDES